MMELFFQIAGTVVRVTGPDGKIDCREFGLNRYLCDGTKWDHWLELSIVQKLSPPEGELIFSAPTKRIYLWEDTQLRYEGTVSQQPEDGYIRIARRGNHSRVEICARFLRGIITSKLILNAMEAEHLIVSNHGLLLHASYIRWQGRAILFTAPSGTGKSTQAALWCRYRGAELINGDRAAVVAQPEGIVVRGIPFAGSSGVNQNVTLPLGAIVYLSQAPTTGIQRLEGVGAFRRIWEGCSVNVWNREDLTLCAQTVTDVLEKVPVFHLACTPDESAVMALEEVFNTYSGQMT